MTELLVLQTVRLKGRITGADLAERVGPASDVVARLVSAGLLVGETTLRLSPAGRARLEDLLAEERRDVDSAALTGRYDEFRRLNSDFKTLVSRWQLGQVGADAVLRSLTPIHGAAVRLVEEVSVQVPRLAGYADRLDAALRKVNAGDMSWLTRPLVDSYHTVWFELHEELLSVTGRTRDEHS